MTSAHAEQSVSMPLAATIHPGLLAIPDNAKGLVIFAHGSGSSRLSPRNAFIARAL
jgi:putative phosphoribosyl transferase